MKKEKNIVLYYNSKKIKEVIEKKGFKLTVLAENVGCSRNLLYKILTNEIGYTVYNYVPMIHIAKEIGLELKYLMDFETFKKESKERKELIK